MFAALINWSYDRREIKFDLYYKIIFKHWDPILIEYRISFYLIRFIPIGLNS